MKHITKYLSLKKLTVITALITCQSSFAGVGVHLNFKNETGKVTEFTVCSPHPKNKCRFPYAVLANKQEAEIYDYELTNDRPFNWTTTVYVDSKPLCKVHSTGRTSGSRPYPPRIAGFHLEVERNDSKEINPENYDCIGTSSQQGGIGGDTIYINVTVGKKLETIKPQLFLPLTPGKIINYVKSEQIKTDQHWGRCCYHDMCVRCAKATYAFYEVTCQNGSFSTFSPHFLLIPMDWSNGEQTYNLSFDESHDLRKYVHDRIGQVFCQIPPKLKTLHLGDYVAKVEERNGTDRLGRRVFYYDVTCKEGSAQLPSTFGTANAVHSAWTNGKKEYSIAWKDAHLFNEFDPRQKAIRIGVIKESVAKPYCIGQ